MKGKAIYSPSGKAAEYARFACNFYTGCSNGCEYCYCRKGVLAHTWSNKPKLKQCFESDQHALGIFEKELVMNKAELQEHGLFFSFTTDPMLFETYDMTMWAAQICYDHKVPVTILTKCTWFLNDFLGSPTDFAKIGFTLTGCNWIEGKAPSNDKRIAIMRVLHRAGFKTWASIEPVINTVDSMKMIRESMEYCDEYKVGLLSGKAYPKEDLTNLYEWALYAIKKPIYWKDSFCKGIGFDANKWKLGFVEAEKSNQL